MNEKNPVPVTFNKHKHHFKFLLNQIEIWKNLDWTQAETELLVIGENLLDFYTGDLTGENICSECIQLLKNKNIYDRDTFKKWLSPLEYRKLELSDTSVWVIKEANNHYRYIHVHPAKQSPHTIRVRASTLKTILALIIKTGNISSKKNVNLQTVNNIRTEYLHLSPIKSLQHGKGILKLWEMFVTHYKPHCY